jgi:hypothetical protein
MSAEKIAQASHDRLENQLKEYVAIRQEIGRLISIIDSQSDRIKAFEQKIEDIREWAKTLRKPKSESVS